MTFFNFETTTHGKWILAGEHSVLRGNGALVFPLDEKKLTLRFSPVNTRLNAEYTGVCGEDMHLLFWSVLEQGIQLLERSLNQLYGHFNVYNDIPIGVGMGASAALCVAMARWFAAQKLLNGQEVHEFARQLENLFHGQSSGLDIAGVAANKGIYFKQGQFEPLSHAWRPVWFLSSCEQIGITSHCIHQVNELWVENPSFANEIDHQMNQAVSQARLALAEKKPDSFSKLAGAINLAGDCFKQWDLVSDTLQRHMDLLREAGAIAVKPTGSGGGGYVVSLWESAPNNMKQLIPI